MSCPRCSFPNAEGPSCPRCGVVFAKLTQERPRPTRPLPPAAAEPPSGSSSPLLWYLLFGALAVVAAAGWLRAPKAPTAPPVEVSAEPADDVDGTTIEEPAALAVPAALPPEVPEAPPPAGMPPADYRAFEELAARIAARRVTAADIEAAVALQARHPSEPAGARLVTELMLTLAFEHVEARRYSEGIALLRRAAALPWADGRTKHALLNTLTTASDWRAAEAYAKELLAADRADADAWYALGYALFRLDRNRDAAQALRTCLELKNDDRAQELLARIAKTASDERGMTEQNLSHFHVRYDGAEHVEVGREIVVALERHYATLVNAFDHRPQNPIPVILFSGEKYHEAAGAPVWSGGNFDSLDGRIRMPIGGLTRSLTPGIDSTLMHELTHAFIADKSGGVAPRDVHEGMAQYMEGERLSSKQLADLAQGRIGGVHGFYTGALSFVEYLIGQRGPGGMNDLFTAMAETGNVNDAFRQVYGQDYTAIQKAWSRRLEQRHGS